jgi:hypothetical protein
VFSKTVCLFPLSLVFHDDLVRRNMALVMGNKFQAKFSSTILNWTELC